MESRTEEQTIAQTDGMRPILHAGMAKIWPRTRPCG